MNLPLSKRCASLILLLLLTAPASLAEHYDEYTVKAALLYNFTKFVEWPNNSIPGKEPEYRICIYGDDPYGKRLDALEQRERSNITVYRHDILRESIRNCQIIFIAETTEERLIESIAYLDKTPVLTVGETPNFVARGGIIGLVRDKDRIKFEINLKAANKAGLAMSSQLLRIAQRVIKE